MNNVNLGGENVKRFIKWIILAVILFLVGIRFFNGNFISELVFFLLFPLALAVCILVRELSYVFFGAINGICPHIIYLGPFTFFKIDGKLKVRFKMKWHQNFCGNMSGIDLPKISSEEEFQAVRKKLIRAYIESISMSFVFSIILIALIFMCKPLSEGYFKEFLIVTTVMSAIFGIISMRYGRGKQVKTIKENEMEAAYELILKVQNYKGIEQLKDYRYLISKIKENVKSIAYRDFENDIGKEIFFNTVMVIYHVKGIVDELPDNTVKSMQYIILKKNDIINDSKFNKSNKFYVLDFVHSIILYLELIEGKREQALDMYDFYEKNLMMRDNEYIMYTLELLKYAVDINDNYDYIMELKNKIGRDLYLGEGAYEIDKKIFELKNSQRGNIE